MTKSQKAILASAKNLFWKYGLKKVTVEEICEYAGVSKMTFYRRFVNKEHAAEEILEAILEDNLRRYSAIMDEKKPFPERVNEILHLKHQESKNLSKEFINEILTEDASALSELIHKHTLKSYKAIIADFEKAKKEGWVRADLKPEFIIEMLGVIKSKMQDENFLKMFNSMDEAIMELSNFFFYGVFVKR
ncbi:TetR/AcrR family transcriptional regulator [Marivirga tractuosa]|uniref:TetR/AcrR family transcriptional regulator n=1 Tax=Marivirga tractuosa TaxID=1006 RepID=UPI0035CF8AA1